MLNRISGILFGLACIGSGVYALVAVPLELPPVSWVIERESLLRDGTYGMVEAWAVTWFHLLAAGALPFALVELGRALLTKDPRPTLEGSAAQRARSLGRTRAAWGFLVTALTGTFYALIVFDPEDVAVVGFLGRLGLVLGPFAAYAGPMLLLDGLLAPTAQTVLVESVQDDPADSERRSINGRYTLEPKEADSLRVGGSVSIVATRVFNTVISATKLDPYR